MKSCSEQREREGGRVAPRIPAARGGARPEIEHPADGGLQHERAAERERVDRGRHARGLLGREHLADGDVARGGAGDAEGEQHPQPADDERRGGLQRQPDLRNDLSGGAGQRDQHRRIAARLGAARRRADDERADHHGHRVGEERVRALPAVVAGDVAQPRPGPQAEVGEVEDRQHRHRGREAPEDPRAEDGSHDAELGADPAAGIAAAPLGHRDENPHRRRRGEAAKHPQDAAPAERRQRGRDRHGGQHAAQPADGDRDPGDEGDLRRREPLRVGLDDGHQPGRDADADDHARDDQGREALGEREQRESRGGDQAQRGLHVARADPVERHAARQLREPRRRRACRRRAARARSPKARTPPPAPAR